MTHRDIVLIGTSAGGLEVLRGLLGQIPADLPAAIFIVMHLPVSPTSILPAILQPCSSWPVLPAVDGASIRHGTITVAVNDRHLLFDKNHLRLSHGPRENRTRPSIDAAFRSGALAFGRRCIGVVLTGALDDGTAGLWAIKDRGGVAVVQSPEEASFPSMPKSAIAHVAVDHVVPMAALRELLNRLTREPLDARVDEAPRASLEIENRIAHGESALKAGVLELGTPSLNTCPHCHGTLLEVANGGPPRFRCHTGHVFTPASLLVDLDKTIDNGLLDVMRAIEERQFLLQQLIETHKLSGNEEHAQEYARQAEDARERGDAIRRLAMTLPLTPEEAA